MAYEIDSRSYLKRAKYRMNEDSLHSLFYAALELRCGIESRMQQYLNSQEHISKRKKKGWQIAKLGKNIEKAFRTGNKITKLNITNKKSGKHLQTLYYTPVTSTLQKQGKKLGNYLHAAKKFHSSSENFWDVFRTVLINVSEGLDIANYGTLLGPPLIHPNKKQMYMNVELLQNESYQEKLSEIGGVGNDITMQVEYLNILPKEVISKG